MILNQPNWLSCLHRYAFYDSVVPFLGYILYMKDNKFYREMLSHLKASLESLLYFEVAF